MMVCLYPRLDLFNHPDAVCMHRLVYSSIIMACLYPRLGLFTGVLINHDGVFISQTGFIYWFTHQSSWHVCIPD